MDLFSCVCVLALLCIILPLTICACLELSDNNPTTALFGILGSLIFIMLSVALIAMGSTNYEVIERSGIRSVKQPSIYYIRPDGTTFTLQQP